MPCCTNLRRTNAARAPVESLPLRCVSCDPQMLLSSHDSSQRVLLSLRPRTRDLGGGRVRTTLILQDVCQPRTGVTDDSFSLFPSRLAVNKVTACAFYMLSERIQCMSQWLFSFQSLFIQQKKADAYLLPSHTVPY